MSQETDRLQERIQKDREEIGRTLDEIQDRLSMGRLLDQATGYMKSGGVNLADSARNNPLPLILTGIGLTWLIGSSNSSDQRVRHSESEDVASIMDEHRALHDAVTRAHSDASAIRRGKNESESAFQDKIAQAKAKALSIKRTAGETAEAFRDRVDDALGQAEKKASDLMERTRSAGETVAESVARQGRAASRTARDAQSAVSSFYHDQPLVAAAFGVAAGAVLSALVPPTRVEQRALDKYGEGVKQGTKKAAAAAVQTAKTAASEGVRAAAKVAEDGLHDPSQKL